MLPRKKRLVNHLSCPASAYVRVSGGYMEEHAGLGKDRFSCGRSEGTLTAEAGVKYFCLQDFSRICK